MFKLLSFSGRLQPSTAASSSSTFSRTIVVFDLQPRRCHRLQLRPFKSETGRDFRESNSDSDANVNAHFVEKDDFGYCDDGHDKFGKMGSEDYEDLNFFGSDNGEFNKNQSSNFDSFDKVVESDEEVEEEEEEEEEEDGSGSDDSFMVLDSFDKNCVNREEVRRVEVEEDEFRHPIVREVCRLINLRSAWNPKLEGELRHLLRSIKPRQICAVLRSQADERVALNFFTGLIGSGGIGMIL
ncbi:hypothetical protein LWI29_020909 [Acer saccharum]|uniref:Uncharacterized protein n=1 Tax=Acer saccharum TaxID=4024 RepID=A0AA39RSD0_ACESA|nr:hypothetical protein LWI29_020909 [Acer saccharum]